MTASNPARTPPEGTAPGNASEGETSSEPASPLAPGDLVGERYLVGTVIGEGGMGLVCEATHVALGVPVAIKLIRPAYKNDFEFVQRFLNEARRAALLKSEHVARVHDVGQLETGEPYLVMERLEGIVLDAYLERAGPLLPEDAVALALQVCDGLAEAHAQGVVHRDIKPGNLFLVHMPNGRINVKILDFGISKDVKEDAPSTLTNRDKSLGSPWYMSPEQMMDSSSVDHRSDIWSLGVVLFELLTNQRPFDGSSVPEVCAKVLTGPTPSLRTVQPGIDPGLEAVVSRCLAKEPGDRFPDVQGLADALQSLAPRRSDTNSHRSWQPVGDFLGAPPTTDKAGSIAPLATTRRSGSPPPIVPEDRARWFSAAAIVACVTIAGVVVASLLGSSRANTLSDLGFETGGLLPGPEPLPLERGDEPLYLAAPAAAPEPEIRPLPTDAQTLEALTGEDARRSEGDTYDQEPPSTGAGVRRGGAGTQVEQAERVYGEPPPGSSSNELHEALGRVRDEYSRSFAFEQESEELEQDATSAPPEEPPPPKPQPRARPKPDRVSPEPKSAITEAGDRYGL